MLNRDNLLRKTDANSLRVINSWRRMDGLAKERLSRNQSATAPLTKQPGALLRAGQLTPIRQLVDERLAVAFWVVRGSVEQKRNMAVYPEECRYL